MPSNLRDFIFAGILKTDTVIKNRATPWVQPVIPPGWRGKTGMAGNSATKNRSGKFHRPRIFLLHADAHGSHADAALHNFSGIAYLCGGRTHRSLNMGFF